MTAAAALAIVVALLYAGRRDVTRPAVAFGVIWFGCVALAQLRLTELETEWSGGFTLLVFAAGLAFMLAATLAGGTATVRGSITARREDYHPQRLITAAIVLFAGGIVGTTYKAHVLGGVPLLSGNADKLRGNAYANGEIVVPAWSTALTDGFFLAMWCALAAIWIVRGRAPRRQIAALWLLAAASLFGVALLASRNTILLAALVPLAAAYVVTAPGRKRAGLKWLAVGAGVVILTVGGLFVARLGEQSAGNDSFLDQELERQSPAVRPLVPFYINGVYPFEAANRLYEAVPDREPYAYGGNSLSSLPDAAFPEGKPAFGSKLARLMEDPGAPDSETRSGTGRGLSWSVGTYLARLYGDAGWLGALLGSLLLGLGFGALYRWARGGAGLVPAALVGFLAYYAAFMSYDNLLSFTLIAAFDVAALGVIDLYARGRLDERARSLTAPATIDAAIRRVETRPLPFLAALIVVAGIVWIHAGRGIAFFGDEWDFLHGRRSNATEAFLVPHNEHLVVALVAYFKLMWAAVGLENYWPYVVANVLVHLAGVALVFELFRRRAGVMVAFAAAALLAFFGRGYSDVLWDFQIAFMAAVVFGIAAFMLVQRRGLTRAVLATILLALAVAWAAWGVAFALVIALQLVLERSWRRLAVPLVPLGLYAAWFQHWASDRANVAELTQVPRFVADAFAGTLANLGGLPLSWGRVLAFVVVAALVLWLVRVRRPAPVQVAALALPLVGFLMTAAGRAGAGTATEARYAWPFAVFVLFAAAYVLPPVRLDRRALAVLATLVTGAVASNLATLHDASARNRADADSRLAQLGALDLAREAVAPDFVLGPVASFGHFRADRYYSATADYGRPGYDEGRLLTLNATARSLADSANLRASAPRLLPRAKAPGPCSKLPPTAPGPPPELALPGDGLLVVPAADQEVRITYRRFGPTYLEDQPSVITVRTGLVPPPTRAQTPWTLRFESRAPFKLCPAPA